MLASYSKIAMQWLCNGVDNNCFGLDDHTLEV